MSALEPTVIVVGNSIAAMVSAISLGEAGWRVTLVSPSKRLGGHFAGLVLGGHTFDAGMVFLEFTSYNAQPGADIASYDPSRRNDVGRFFPLVESTLRRYAEWRVVEAPLMRVQGRILPDLLIANHTASLLDLAPGTREAIAGELRALTSEGRSPLHASRKATEPGFIDVDLHRASVANHGQTFHDLLIEPLCLKITARPTADFLARFHRLVWIPIFYPETLVAELSGTPQELPHTVFSYPKAGTVAALVQQMEQQLRASHGVTVVEGAVTSLRHDNGCGPFVIETAAGLEATGDRLVWAADQERLLSLLGEDSTQRMDRGSVVLVSALVHTDQVVRSFSTLVIPEDERWPFRVTNQSVAAGEVAPKSRLSCEWNAAFVPGTPEEISLRTTEALIALGVVSRPEAVAELRVDVLKDALLLPTASNGACWAGRRTSLDAIFPTVPRLGPAAPFGATSFNDQIVQGMKVVHDLRANP